MSVWQQKTADIQQKINRINDLLKKFDQIIQNEENMLRRNLNDVIKNGGLNSNVQISNLIISNEFYENYENTVIIPLQRRLKEESKNLDLTAMLGKTGQLQQELIQLRDQLRTAKEDAENQSVRDSVLRNAEGSVSKRQIFLLGRPVREESIPYMWMASALFFFLGLSILLLMAPIGTTTADLFGVGASIAKASSFVRTNNYGPSLTEQMLSIFANPWVIGITVFSLVVVVVVLILKIRGYIR